jgi:TPR repeat protein
MKSGQNEAPIEQTDTELVYAAWMNALLATFEGKISRLAAALELRIRADNPSLVRRREDQKRLENTVRHWYSESRRSVPGINQVGPGNDIVCQSLIDVCQDRQVSPPFSHSAATFENVLHQLQDERNERRRIGKRAVEPAPDLYKLGILYLPVTTCGDFDLRLIGQESALVQNNIPEYVPREIDQSLVSALDSASVRFVTVAGEPKSGKTRTLLQALKASMHAKHEIYWLSSRSGAVQDFIDFVPKEKSSQRIIFLDDLQRFDFNSRSGLSLATLKELGSRGKVVATVHENGLSQLLDLPRQIHRERTIGISPPSGEQNLEPTDLREELANSIFMLRRELTPAEEKGIPETLRLQIGDAKKRHGLQLAAELASVSELKERCDLIAEKGDEFAAVLLAAKDCYLAFPIGAEYDFILELSKLHFRDLQFNSIWRTQAGIDAFSALTSGVVPGSSKAILTRQLEDSEKFALLDGLWPEIRPNLDFWNPDIIKSLLDDDEKLTLAKRAAGQDFWPQAEEILNELISSGHPDAQLELALILFRQDKDDVARVELTKAAEAGNASAQNYLGVVIATHDEDIKTAIVWYEKAALAGHSMAQQNLALNLRNLGDMESAWKWLEVSADQGEVSSIAWQGVLYEDEGNSEAAKDCYIRAANEGLDWAQRNLGQLYRDEGDNAKAITFLTLAADQGDLSAQNHLANMLRDDNQIEAAREWYTKAADSGFDWAQYNLAGLLDYEGKQEEAKSWYLQAADQGNSAAMNQLGVLESRNDSMEEAKKWYLKAAESGHEWGQYNYAQSLRSENDFEGAQHWMHLAAEQGLAAAKNMLGRYCELEGDTKGAKHLYLEAAEAGDSYGQANLANILLDEGDREAAITWLKKSAAQKNLDAINRLGVIYQESGNVDEARQLYLEAAENDHPWGQMNVAMLLRDEGDDDAAERWLKLAAEYGLSAAMTRLGKLYLDKNRIEEAKTWYSRGADLGEEWGHFRLGQILEKEGKTDEAHARFKIAADLGLEEALEALRVGKTVSSNVSDSTKTSPKAIGIPGKPARKKTKPSNS